VSGKPFNLKFETARPKMHCIIRQHFQFAARPQNLRQENQLAERFRTKAKWISHA
jgi:hypothetical protein